METACSDFDAKLCHSTALVVDGHAFHVELVISDWHLHSIFKWYGLVHQFTHAFAPDQLHSLVTTDI